ncbi:MAG: hypothetical protein ACRDFX_09440, partial [Chloroflexota bacterium]
APIYHKAPDGPIERAITASGTNIISSTFHTAGYVWLHDSSKAAAAAENVARLQNPLIQSVYFKEHLANGSFAYVRSTGADLFLVPGMENANQYLLSSFVGPDGPDVVVFFMENTASLPGGEATWKGDHGGADWNAQHLRIIMSGPGVRHGKVSYQPAPLMDLAPTALKLMGIRDTGMQGIPLTDGMISPTKSELQASHAQGAQIAPVIDALSAESNAEKKAGK